MARVADYSIIADGWVVEAKQDTINFSVPSNIDAGSRCVLGFMLQVDNLDDLTLTLRLNGTKVSTWNYSEGNRIRFFQEVISAASSNPATTSSALKVRRAIFASSNFPILSSGGRQISENRSAGIILVKGGK